MRHTSSEVLANEKATIRLETADLVFCDTVTYARVHSRRKILYRLIADDYLDDVGRISRSPVPNCGSSLICGLQSVMGSSASWYPVLTKSCASRDYSLRDRKAGGNSGGNCQAMFYSFPRNLGNLHEFSVASLATISKSKKLRGLARFLKWVCT